MRSVALYFKAALDTPVFACGNIGGGCITRVLVSKVLVRLIYHGSGLRSSAK